jgi:hypothetical protein
LCFETITIKRKKQPVSCEDPKILVLSLKKKLKSILKKTKKYEKGKKN